MNTGIYSIFDNVASVFNKPFTELNDNTAKRAFIRAIEKQPDKNDYVLYYCGSFDDSSGCIVVEKNARKIMSGFDVVAVEEQAMPQMLRPQN